MSSTTYDSQRVRLTAQQLREAYKDVSEEARPQVKTLRAEIDDAMQGETAEALDARLCRLECDIRRCADALDTLSARLTRFADEIDRADSRVSAALTGVAR